MAMLMILRGAAWVFLRVALIAALDWFTTWAPKDNVEGVNLTWANANEQGMKRRSKRAAPPKKRYVPCFARTNCPSHG
jgi:hypothetical protein